VRREEEEPNRTEQEPRTNGTDYYYNMLKKKQLKKLEEQNCLTKGGNQFNRVRVPYQQKLLIPSSDKSPLDSGGCRYGDEREGRAILRVAAGVYDGACGAGAGDGRGEEMRNCEIR
jgi:hypothetical protein